MLKQGLDNIPTWQDWAAEHTAGGKTAAVDPTLISSNLAKKLSDKVKRAGGLELMPLDENLVDKVWGSARPPRPCNPVKIQPEEFSGMSITVKLQQLRKDLEKKNRLGMVISLLDEIAWLFNLRGSDIPYNPVFFSYAVVTLDTACLYVDYSKISSEVQEYLIKNHVSLRPYDAIFEDTRALSAATFVSTDQNQESQFLQTSKFLISNKTSWALKRALGGDKLVEEVRSPIGDAKAIKNETELEGMKACQIRDGAALIEFFAWLENQLTKKNLAIDEVQAAQKLEALRAKHKYYVGLSFDTISSTGAK